jgi:pimeloyl-ACP methyl ester carboxylesterase
VVGHDIGGGTVMRAHLVEDVPVRALALVDAAVIGPWNTPFTEHTRHHADAYRTMPPRTSHRGRGRTAGADGSTRPPRSATPTHFLPEDAPEATTGALAAFLA